MNLAHSLRTQYPIFRYTHYHWFLDDKGLNINYFYQIDRDLSQKNPTDKNLNFKHAIRVQSIAKKHLSEFTQKTIENFIFHIGIVEMFNYWKLTCSPQIIIQAGQLTNRSDQSTTQSNQSASQTYQIRTQSNQSASQTYQIRTQSDQSASQTYQIRTQSDQFTIQNKQTTNPAGKTASETQQPQDQEQPIDFWHKLLIKGMGEYFFVNKIDFTSNNFVTIKNDFKPFITNKENINWSTKDTIAKTEKILIAMGGGKDSAVTSSLLMQEFPDKVSAFSVNTDPASQACIDTLGFEKHYRVDRFLDATLLQMNKEQFLNGHIPFSSILAFLSTFVSLLFKQKYAVFSNEQSSNQGNTIFKGQVINHQYSKSFEFEKDYRSYLKTNFPTIGVEYFSFLRPLHEIQIGQLFSHFCRPLLPIIRSCNRQAKSNSWCGSCSKCLFAYLCLYPFVDTFTLNLSFAKDIYADTKLIDIALELIGKKNYKPLDCVGTHQESLASLEATLDSFLQYHQKNKSQTTHQAQTKTKDEAKNNNETKAQTKNETEDKTDNLISQLHHKKYLTGQTKSLDQLLSEFSDNHVLSNRAIDRKFLKLLKKKLVFANKSYKDCNKKLKKELQTVSKTPTQTILLFGLGREAVSSYQYLKNHFPHYKFILFDDKILDNLDQYWQKTNEVILDFSSIKKIENLLIKKEISCINKTPGIPWRHPILQVALKNNVAVYSNLDLFAIASAKLNTFLIGVTGTKGKSTTSSMIHHVLTQLGESALLAGNIGKPALDLLPEILKFKKVDDQKTDQITKQKIYKNNNQKTDQIANTKIDKASDQEIGKNFSKLKKNQVIIVLELSSHQLSKPQYHQAFLNSSPTLIHPQIAILQEVGTDHLDYYKSLQSYQRAKQEITASQSQNDYFIYFKDCDFCALVAQKSQARLTSFSRNEAKSINIENTQIKGVHNKINAIPAIKIAEIFGYTHQQAIEALKNFRPLPHRLELVATIAKTQFYNDSLSTTPEACIMALESFSKQKIVLILGGKDRGLQFDDLVQKIIKSKNIVGLILFPDTGNIIAEQLCSIDKTINNRIKLAFVDNMQDAVSQSFEMISKINTNSVVLLSPASSSFNLFKDYADRGDQFRLAIKNCMSQVELISR